MAKKTFDAKITSDNVESIQEGFQKVLAAHGINNLRVSNFRLTDIEHEKGVSAATTADGHGCWRWACVMTPTGPVCHKIWDPNC